MPAHRSFLVPEFDGEVVAATAPIEELLLALANGTDDYPPLSGSAARGWR